MIDAETTIKIYKDVMRGHTPEQSPLDYTDEMLDYRKNVIEPEIAEKGGVYLPFEWGLLTDEDFETVERLRALRENEQ
jgi:hypothetical protein